MAAYPLLTGEPFFGVSCRTVLTVCVFSTFDSAVPLLGPGGCLTCGTPQVLSAEVLLILFYLIASFYLIYVMFCFANNIALSCQVGSCSRFKRVLPLIFETTSCVFQSSSMSDKIFSNILSFYSWHHHGFSQVTTF